MPDLTPSIDLLRSRAERLAEQIRGRAQYARIAEHSPDMTAALVREHQSHLAALDILAAADALECGGDCLLCDAPDG